MERKSHDSESDSGLPLPEGERREAAEEQRAVVEISFGRLDFVAPGGGRWDEWVVTHGIINAVLEGRHIDDRTAYYIAQVRETPRAWGLRKLIRTGEIDYDAVKEDLSGSPEGKIQDIQAWSAWLAHYCDVRPDRSAIDKWPAAIRTRDRIELEWWRRKEVVALSDELFQRVSPPQRVARAGQPGWSGLVRHDNRAGGWILTEERAEVRRVWETDSNEELTAAFVALVDTQRRWVIANFRRPETER